MARKGSQQRSSLDRKATKLQNIIPGSLDTSFIENKEKKGKSDQKFTYCDQSNNDMSFKPSHSFTEQSINSDITRAVSSCKQRISDVSVREQPKSGRIEGSDRTKIISDKAADVTENEFSDAPKPKLTTGVMLDVNFNISNNLFGKFLVGSAAAMVTTLDAISGWGFRSASYVLKVTGGWIEQQKPRVSSFISYVHHTYDNGIAKIKVVFPVIFGWVLHFGKLALFLFAIWLGCSIRGLNSLFHLGTTSLFTILWCSLLSIIAIVGFIKLLFTMVIAFLLLIFVGMVPAILLLAISSTVVLWLYGSFWMTSFVTFLGGASFGLRHERIALFVTTVYSLHCARTYNGWLGLFLGLNLSFISSDVLVYVLKNNSNEYRGPDDCSREFPSTSGREADLTSDDEVSRLLSSSDHYTALGFNRLENVDISVLKREYRKRAMLVHPDKNMGNEKAVEAFKKLQNAYEVLLDSIKRKNYDDDLRREDLLNYIRSFQASAHKNERHGIFSSESTNIEAEDSGSYGESRKIFCKKCGTFHVWAPIERLKSQARWCQDCNDFHPSKDGDGWLEQSSIPVLFGLMQKVDTPRAYVCSESRIYNATQWFNCQGIRVPANTHKPSFHVNISLNNSKHSGNPKASSSSPHRDGGGGDMTEEDLYEWLQNAMNSGRFEPDFSPKEGASSSNSGSRSSGGSCSKKKRKGKRQW